METQTQESARLLEHSCRVFDIKMGFWLTAGHDVRIRTELVSTFVCDIHQHLASDIMGHCFVFLFATGHADQYAPNVIVCPLGRFGTEGPGTERGVNETRKPTCNAFRLALERLEEFGKCPITSPCTTGKGDDFAVHLRNAAVREVQTWCPPGAMSVEEGTRARSAVRHQRLCLIQLPQKAPEE